jgi:hypothetical protein
MKFIIGFLIAIGLLVFVFVLIFRGGSSHTAATSTPLIDYANTSTEMEMTIEGPVTADQNHKELQINIGDNESTIEVFQGYEQTLLQSKTYANNSTAYADFLKALQLAGFTLGNSNKALADERGYCSSGQRYVFTIEDGNDQKQRFWSSSCGEGTFKGNTSLVNTLFQAQIPDYDTFANSAF